MRSGIPIAPISNDSPNGFTSTTEIISPGKTTEIRLNKTTKIPNEKINQTIEWFIFFSKSFLNSGS